MNKLKIKRLKKYFENQEEILTAFVFGSQIKTKCAKMSDWDIAVYFRPKKEDLLASNNDKLLWNNRVGRTEQRISRGG